MNKKKKEKETVPHDRKIYTLQNFARSIRSINFVSHPHKLHYQIHENCETKERSLYRLSTSGMFFFVVRALFSLSCSAFCNWSVYGFRVRELVCVYIWRICTRFVRKIGKKKKNSEQQRNMCTQWWQRKREREIEQEKMLSCIHQYINKKKILLKRNV